MNFLEAMKELKEGRCRGIRHNSESDFLWVNNNGRLVSNITGSIHNILTAEKIISADWVLVPKPKVKKTVSGWVNLIVGSHHKYPIIPGSLWDSKEEALGARNVTSKDTQYCGEPLFISHEYETEETL